MAIKRFMFRTIPGLRSVVALTLIPVCWGMKTDLRDGCGKKRLEFAAVTGEYLRSSFPRYRCEFGVVAVTLSTAGVDVPQAHHLVWTRAHLQLVGSSGEAPGSGRQ